MQSGRLAQLEERCLDKAKVTGSSPVSFTEQSMIFTILSVIVLLDIAVVFFALALAKRDD